MRCRLNIFHLHLLIKLALARVWCVFRITQEAWPPLEWEIRWVGKAVGKELQFLWILPFTDQHGEYCCSRIKWIIKTVITIIRINKIINRPVNPQPKKYNSHFMQEHLGNYWAESSSIPIFKFLSICILSEVTLPHLNFTSCPASGDPSNDGAGGRS